MRYDNTTQPRRRQLRGGRILMEKIGGREDGGNPGCFSPRSPEHGGVNGVQRPVHVGVVHFGDLHAPAPVGEIVLRSRTQRECGCESAQGRCLSAIVIKTQRHASLSSNRVRRRGSAARCAASRA